MKSQMVQKPPRTYGYYFPKPSQLYGGNRFLISTVARPFSYAFEMLTCHLAGTGGLGLASRTNIRTRETKNRKPLGTGRTLPPAGPKQTWTGGGDTAGLSRETFVCLSRGNMPDGSIRKHHYFFIFSCISV